jgi:hypothetical protein
LARPVSPEKKRAARNADRRRVSGEYGAVREPPDSARRLGLRALLGIGALRALEHGRGDEAGVLADLPLDGVGDPGVLLEEGLGVLAPLADPLAVEGEPRARLLDDAGLNPEVEQLAGLGNPFRKGGAILFLTTLTRVWLPTTESRSLIAPMRRMSSRTEA